MPDETAATREHECVPWDDPRWTALCDQMGWNLAAFIECQEYLHEHMTRSAAAISEGFCPRCTRRLTPSDLGAWCEPCDLYHRVAYAADGCLISVGAATGYFARGGI